MSQSINNLVVDTDISKEMRRNVLKWERGYRSTIISVTSNGFWRACTRLFSDNH